MKKIIVVSLVGLILLSFAACGKKNTPTDTVSVDPNSINETELIEIAEKASKHLTLRQYDEVIELFDDTMKEAMPKENLQAAWLGAAGNIGRFIEIAGSEYSYTDGFPSVTAFCKFEEKTLSVRYVFDESQRISGLWLSLVYQKPEVTKSDKFKEEIIQIGASEPKMYGILTLPEGANQPPVVIYVHGSGVSDLNETIGEGKNRQFKDLAHGLAEQGIASIRYDKRHFAYPELIMKDLERLTVRVEALDDVDAAIKLAASDARLDKSKIYVYGHSLGGMLIPQIAASNPDLGGVISAAGSLRRVQDLMYDQSIAKLKADGITGADFDAGVAQAKAVKDSIDAIKSDEGEYVYSYPPRYWNSMNKVDNSALSKAITMPMMILQGSADFQVYADVDYPLWQDTLTGKENVVFHKYDGLNHLMMPTKGKSDMTEYAEENHVAQVVIDDVAAFIKEGV